MKKILFFLIVLLYSCGKEDKCASSGNVQEFELIETIRSQFGSYSVDNSFDNPSWLRLTTDASSGAPLCFEIYSGVDDRVVSFEAPANDTIIFDEVIRFGLHELSPGVPYRIAYGMTIKFVNEDYSNSYVENFCFGDRPEDGCYVLGYATQGSLNFNWPKLSFDQRVSLCVLGGYLVVSSQYDGSFNDSFIYNDNIIVFSNDIDLGPYMNHPYMDRMIISGGKQYQLSGSVITSFPYNSDNYEQYIFH